MNALMLSVCFHLCLLSCGGSAVWSPFCDLINAPYRFA